MTKKILCWMATIVVIITSFGLLPVVAVNAAVVTPTDGSIYYIKNKHSGLYLQVENDSSDYGANVCQSTGTGSLGQRWILNQNSDGSYRLQPATDMTGGLCLDVYNGLSDNLTNIQIWGSNGYSAQNFKLASNDDGSYAILTAVSDYSRGLDVLNFSTASGANVIQYDANYSDNQLWYFEEAQWPGGGGQEPGGSDEGLTIGIDNNGYADQLMQFVNANNGQFLTASSTSNNSTVGTSSSSSKSNQWKLVKRGSDYYQIVNAASGYVLAPSGNNVSSGSAIVVTGNTNSNSQYWKLSAVKNDSNSNTLYYSLLNYANTNLAITLNGSSYALSNFSSSGAQSFRFNSYGCEGFAGYSKDMSGSEKASVTGGILGDVVYASNLSSLQTYASGNTPYTIVINSNISQSSLTKVTVGSNKTFVGSFANNTLNNVHFRVSSSGNVIYKNIMFKHDASINDNDDIQMYITNGNNYWIDHCTFDGHSSVSDSDIDKHMYVGVNADYVSVTGCVFKGHNYGLILGYPQDTGGSSYIGYPRMTIANNYFYKVKTRAPGLMRYGYFHVYNNFIYDFNLGYTPYTECDIYSEKNYFDKGSQSGKVVDDKGVGRFTDSGSVVSSSVSGLATSATSWRPSSNYGYETRDVSGAKTWCQNYAGVQSSKITYAID